MKAILAKHRKVKGDSLSFCLEQFNHPERFQKIIKIQVIKKIIINNDN